MPRVDQAPSNEGKHLGPIVLIREEDLIDIWHKGAPGFAKKICNMYRSFVWVLFPLKIEFQIKEQVEGNNSARGILHFRPILVAKSKTANIKTDTIRRSFESKLDVPLWHPGVVKRDLFFIVGPSTMHTARIRLDFPRFISYSLRYQVYAVPGLVFGSRLIQNALRSRDARVAYSQGTISLKILYATTTCFFFTLISPLANMKPLIPDRNPLGTLSILIFALSVDAVISSIVVGIIKVLRYSGTGSSKLLLKGTKPIVALICLVLPFHDLLPFFLTILFLVWLSILDSKKMPIISGDLFLPVEWLLLLLYAMLPLVIAMSGGYIFGYQHREIYPFSSTERLMVTITLLGIIFNYRGSKAIGSTAKRGNWSLEAVLLVLIGEYVALASLGGQNYIPPLFITIISVYFVIKLRKN